MTADQSVKYIYCNDTASIFAMMSRNDCMALVRKYLNIRFSREPDKEGFLYVQHLMNEASGIYVAVKGNIEKKQFDVLGFCLHTRKEVTMFSSNAHPVVTYRFMRFIVRDMKEVICFSNVGTMEKLLVRLGFKLISFEHDGRWYRYLPYDNKVYRSDKKADGTVH